LTGYRAPVPDYAGDYLREQPGQWPTPADIKRDHLAAIHEELQRLKDEALDAKLQQEWDEYEQELPK
jgi:hypothetical protein